MTTEIVGVAKRSFLHSLRICRKTGVLNVYVQMPCSAQGGLHNIDCEANQDVSRNREFDPAFEYVQVLAGDAARRKGLSEPIQKILRYFIPVDLIQAFVA